MRRQSHNKFKKNYSIPNLIRNPGGILTLFFWLFYTNIPHDKLKSKLKEMINQCFFHKNGNRRFQYVVIGYKDTYFEITLMHHKNTQMQMS